MMLSDLNHLPLLPTNKDNVGHESYIEDCQLKFSFNLALSTLVQMLKFIKENLIIHPNLATSKTERQGNDNDMTIMSCC